MASLAGPGAVRLLKERALELGFCAVGVAAAGRTPRADRYAEWLAADMHGDMAWMAERVAERLDPGLLVPGARSVIVVAADCRRPPEGPLPAGAGRVARYARGRDYHNVVGRRLVRLRRFLSDLLPGVRVYKSVDAGAVIERAWAAAAGVGGIGRNGNVLDAERGSHMLLGALVCDRELPADGIADGAPPSAPDFDLCGACTACMDACPTGALVEPGVVDARLCVSYLTIERRGPIPAALRPALGQWVMGCDDCQTACPLCADSPAGGDPALAPLPGREALDCADLLGLGAPAFARRFNGSPLRRAGAANLRRNAACRLGNAGDRAATPALARALHADADESVRGAAAWALGRLGGAAARRALEARRGSAAPDERAEIDAALAGL